MTHLLDGNVLVALSVEEHVHHVAAQRWLAGGTRFATCPMTQGTLVRFLVRAGVASDDAVAVLRTITDHRQHDFWIDDLAYTEVELTRVVGHRQVSDAYLAQLARDRNGRVLTFDRGLAALHPDVADPLGGNERG